MATSTTLIKQEKIDDDYDDSVPCANSNVTYARYGTPMTSSPTGVDSTTTLASENQEMVPQLKRMRYDQDSKTFQNGHRNSSDVGPICLPSDYHHYEGNHASNMLASLNAMRMLEQFLDVVLVIDGKEIPCHKVVLCSASKYFADLLFPGDGNRFQQRIHITETSFEIMTQLVEFSYTSRILITGHCIEQLLSAANFFQFTSVCNACESVLKQRLSPATSIAIKRFATRQGCRELAECANNFATEHFVEISASEDFPDLTVKELISLVASPSLNVESEEKVYEAVMTWVRYDVTSRQQHLAKVLEHIRLPLVRPEYLLDVVQTDLLIKENKECEKFLDEARRFQLLVDQRPLMQSCRTQPRLTYNRQRSEVLVVVGGLNKDKMPVADCVYFNFPESCTKNLAPLQLNQTAYSVATVNNNIFVTGGAFHSPYKEVWIYIPSLNTWQQVAPMLEGRYLHASAGLDTCLYVVGGHNGSARLRSVEKYNPDSNTWKCVEPMLKDLSSPCVVACDNMIFVIGGAKGPSPTDIVCDVQFYNPKCNTWRLAAPLPQPERGAVAANLNGTIYVMGQQRSVTAYNRQSNVWMSLRNSHGGHLHGAATVHKGKLYVAGGLHGNSFINGTVEVYDQLNDTWQVVSTLHVPVYAQGFVSIFKDTVTRS
uniref:Kelch-like protein 2 n=1 Tax=Phallusia mammillata TaxID=59560 RepID=A0A6F9DG15_9ASCI|nr:kelch-like protein 2 [Phallusia mammillata]